MRQVGLTARAGVTGLTSLPTMAGDALNSGINMGIHGVNALAGSHIPSLQMPSAVVQNTMSAVGVPQPQNATERVVQDVAGAMGGVSPFVGAGTLLTKAASPTVQAVGKGMTLLPGMQITGAAGAGLGGGTARENDVGPTGQLIAGVLGGAAGAVGPSAALAAARGAKTAASNLNGAVQPIINPGRYVGSQLAQTLGPDAPAVAASIRGAPEFVPGSLPTTAQAGANPTLVATEKSFANANPDFKIGLAARGAQNNAARWEALNSVARTPEDLSDAIAARQAVTGPMYDAAHAQMVPVDQTLTDLAGRPAIRQAMDTASLLAKNEGVPIQWPTPSNPTISGKALDYTNRALGDLIASAKSANNTEQARALTSAQQLLQGWISKNVPGVREAASDYAALSSPVNTMQAGQQIAGTLGTRALDANGLPLLQLSPYKSALTQAIKKQEYGIDPGAHQTLQGIGQDLQRATISNSLRSPGSDTTYNIAANGWLARQLYGENFNGATGLGKGLGALGATLSGHPLVGLGLLAQGNKLGQMTGSRLNEQLGQLLLNPSLLLPYLDAAKVAPQGLLPSLRGNVAQGLLGAATATRASP